jgi:SAM-dependent methyltransferase
VTDLADIRRGWDKAARDDAMYNILTDPSCQGGKWDPHSFFARGTAEIDGIVEYYTAKGLLPKRRQLAMDFGCGVGRLTQALASHYRRVDGVDVSLEMTSLATEYNRYPGKVRYYANPHPDLSVFARDCFDLIYSVITLQHMPRLLQQGYVSEFIRVLHPKGLAVFQIPEGGEYVHPQPWLSMFGTDRTTVERWVAAAGGRLADVELSEHSGPGWTGWRYAAVRA